MRSGEEGQIHPCTPSAASLCQSEGTPQAIPTHRHGQAVPIAGLILGVGDQPQLHQCHHLQEG